MKFPTRRLAAAVMGLSLLGGSIVVGVTPAAAADTQSGSLDPGDPTFERPSGGGPSTGDCDQPSALAGSASYRYDLYEITVTAPELLTLDVDGTFDSYLALYCDSFDPGNPLNNLLIDDDDDGPGLDAAVLASDGVNLVAGRSYILAVTSFSSGSGGAYTVNATSATAQIHPLEAGGGLIDDFEGGLGSWTATGLWNGEADTDACGAEVAPYPDPTEAAYYGQDGVCDFDTGTNSGTLTYNSAILVPDGEPFLQFESNYESESGGTFDRKVVEVSTDGGATWTLLEEILESPVNEWITESADLSAYAGDVVRLRFLFETGDALFNTGRGWFVDEVQLVVPEPDAEATVRVTASTPTAEEGGAPGVFTFTRTGDTGEALTIGYSISGTATSGDDYEPLGLVTFNPGQATVTQPVVAVDDGVEEGDETVTVTLLSGSDYDVGVPISATVTIVDPLPEPEPVDPCEGLDDPAFTDVSDTNVHRDNIRCLAALGITEGGPGGRPSSEYGPRLQTTRGQMASFIARTAEELGVELPAAPADAFDDDDESVHELRINQLAAIGIIGDNGEDGSSYFPGQNITREEMASFVNGLIEAESGAPLASDTDAFTDDEDSPYEADINGLAAAGIVQGTGGGLYDPDGTVQRDSMASFIVRTIQHLANDEPRADEPRTEP